MEKPPLKTRDPGRAALPSEAELRAFAAAAAQVLIEQRPHTAGARSVSRRAGVGLQHLDHRDYQPGDEVRHIDWRQTARRRQPTVRRFEAEAMSDWTILLDVSSSMAVGSGVQAGGLVTPGPKWRASTCVAAAMGYALLQLGQRVGLMAFGQQLRAHCPGGRGPHHYAALARLLAGLQPRLSGERSELGVCARHLQGASTVLVVSDFLADGEMSRDLAALLQRCTALQALQVNDANETRLMLVPPGTPAPLLQDAALDLVDVETGARLQVQAGAAANAQATTERAALTHRLRGFCARSGVPFTDWDIRLPWQHMLLAHLVRARRTC